MWNLRKPDLLKRRLGWWLSGAVGEVREMGGVIQGTHFTSREEMDAFWGRDTAW